jgi:hypothetical protein
MTYAADYNRRAPARAELNAAIDAADQAIREREERERAEIAQKRAARKAQAERAAAQSQPAAAQSQAYDWDSFYRDLDQRIAAKVDARVAAYQDNERASAERLSELTGKLADTRRELAAAVDREAILKERIAALEARIKQPAPLPVVRQWIPNTAALQGELFAHGGALWQCRQNTGQPPQDGPNWVCVSAPGRDGEPGRSLRTRGLYRRDGNYKELDLVVLNGSSFIARRDNPGECPGEDWQVNTLVGKRGEAGERGQPGPRADAAAIEKAMRISGWTAGDDYNATLTHANGQSGATLDLRPMFERFFGETH